MREKATAPCPLVLPCPRPPAHLRRLRGAWRGVRLLAAAWRGCGS